MVLTDFEVRDYSAGAEQSRILDLLRNGVVSRGSAAFEVIS